ncbi:MAG: FGGY-family carbohydrate kinase [Termitinemataceae bacterium]|nr:MAG: FGGY-family carbohydrate kinase [Termitinemataceae bacterium]
MTPTANNFVLCTDIGTSSLKAGIIDISKECSGGKRLKAFVKIPYTIGSSNTDCAAGAYEWEAAFYEALKVISYKNDYIQNIKAICISGNGPTLVCVDKNKIPIKTLHWFDNVPHIKNVKSFFLPHVVSFKKNNPALFEKTELFISCHEWLLQKLGADICTCLPQKLYEPFYYSEEELDTLCLNKKKFPKFVELGSIVGTVSQAAEKICGLRAGTKLVTGGPDFIMALLGSGVIRAGRACDRAGSSEGINYCTDTPPNLQAAHFADGSEAQSKKNIRVLPSAIDGLWNVSVVINESGSLFENYIKDNGKQDQSYDQTLQELLNANNQACTLTEKGEHQFTTEKLPPVLKKIMQQVVDALATLESAGYKISEMYVTGGQSKSALWNKIKSGITGCKLIVPEISDAELTGDAACAAFALGSYGSIEMALDHFLDT